MATTASNSKPFAVSTESTDNFLSSTEYGARYPFPPEKLLARYGSLAGLRAAVEQSAKQAVADGRLMAEDYDACVAFSVGEAARYGLC